MKQHATVKVKEACRGKEPQQVKRIGERNTERSTTKEKEETKDRKPTPSHPPQRQVTRCQVTRTPPPPRGGEGGSQIVAGTSRRRGRGQLKIQLVIQRVQDARGGECTVLWDSGAQISLVTHQYAEKTGFGRRPASIRITGVGAGGGGESNVQYRALLRRRDGSIAEIKPYGVDKITGNASSMNLSKARALFPFAASELESPAGPIQLLIDRAQGVALYRSRFGTGQKQPAKESTAIKKGKMLTLCSKLEVAEGCDVGVMRSMMKENQKSQSQVHVTALQCLIFKPGKRGLNSQL